MKLTERQRRFVEAFIETGNAAEAARRAGYSKKTAHVTGVENLSKPNVKKAIEKRLKEIEAQKTATPEEVMQHLSAAVRGELNEDVVVVEGTGKGFSKAKVITKKISEKDRLKAAELLLKRYAYTSTESKREQELRIQKLEAELKALKAETPDESQGEEIVQIYLPDNGRG